MKKKHGFLIAAVCFYISGISMFVANDGETLSILGYSMFVLGITNTSLFFYYKKNKG